MLNFDRVYNIPALTFPTPSIWPTTSPLLIYKRDAACTPTSTNVPSIKPAPVITTASPIAPPTSVPAVATPSGPPLIVKAWMNPDAGFAECPAIRASTSSAAAAAYAAPKLHRCHNPHLQSHLRLFFGIPSVYMILVKIASRSRTRFRTRELLRLPLNHLRCFRVLFCRLSVWIMGVIAILMVFSLRHRARARLRLGWWR